MKRRIVSIIICLCTLLSLLAVPAAAAYGFTDVAESDYFAKPVAWAVSEGITNGTSATTFSPNQTCTRAQILTFLWRAAGSPEPRGYEDFSPYYDVQLSDYFYKAAVWATENGIVDIEGVFFYPNTLCTRAAAVDYIWHYAKCPKSAEVSFVDVQSGAQISKAVSWAVNYGVTNGTGATTFSPNATCTRGQIVTFLHRYFVEPLNVTPAPLPPVDPGKLDPLPPADYLKHPDWYMTLTFPYEMSNARLAAESESIGSLIREYRANDKYISDSMLVRDNDLMYEIMDRRMLIDEYDSYVNRGRPVPADVQAEYDEFVAKYGDPEPIRYK